MIDASTDKRWELQQLFLRCGKNCGGCGHPLAEHDVRERGNPMPLRCRLCPCPRIATEVA